LLTNCSEFPILSDLSFKGIEMKLSDKLSSFSLKDFDEIEIKKSSLKAGNGLILSYERCMIT
jgi:hypothetical protein